MVDSGERRLRKVPPWFTRLGHLDQLLATWEWRSGPTPWLVMRSRQEPGQPEAAGQAPGAAPGAGTRMTPSADGPGPNCALRYQPDGFRVDSQAVMGRQSAGAGFLKGFIEHGGADRLIALTDSRAHFDDFRALAGQLDGAGREVVWARPLDRQALRRPAPSTGRRRGSTSRPGSGASAASATTASAA